MTKFQFLVIAFLVGLSTLFYACSNSGSSVGPPIATNSKAGLRKIAIGIMVNGKWQPSVSKKTIAVIFNNSAGATNQAKSITDDWQNVELLIAAPDHEYLTGSIVKDSSSETVAVDVEIDDATDSVYVDLTGRKFSCKSISCKACKFTMSVGSILGCDCYSLGNTSQGCAFSVDFLEK